MIQQKADSATTGEAVSSQLLPSQDLRQSADVPALLHMDPDSYL